MIKNEKGVIQVSFTFFVILESCILGTSCSIDAFIAAFSYGSNKITIPLLSVQIINIISSSIFGISFLIGHIVKDYFPLWLTAVICFGVLFVIGISRLLDSIVKSIIRKHSDLSKKVTFSLFNLNFILSLYANPERADLDASQTISPAEAVTIALALSLDSIAVGFGAAFANVNGLVVFLWTLLANSIGIMLGCFLGNKAAHKLPFNISWVSGVVLIALAFMKLV